MVAKTAERVLTVARGQIGVTESPANSNRTKYGAAYGWNGVPWCVIFLWWCFREAGASDLFYGGRKAASCALVRAYAQANGQWVTGGYLPGDLVQMDFTGDKVADHIAIVEKISADGTTLTTIEGNTSSTDKGSQSNGGGVFRRTRRLSQLVGAYRPKYERDIEMEINEFIDSATDRQLLRLVERVQKALAEQSVGPKLAGELANAKAAGITDGNRPQGLATRAEAAVMDVRMYSKIDARLRALEAVAPTTSADSSTS